MSPSNKLKFGPPDLKALVGKITEIYKRNGIVYKNDVRECIAVTIWPDVVAFPYADNQDVFDYDGMMRYLVECRLGGQPANWVKIREMAL